jgi:hypothetical protein
VTAIRGLPHIKGVAFALNSMRLDTQEPTSILRVLLRSSDSDNANEDVGGTSANRISASDDFSRSFTSR